MIDLVGYNSQINNMLNNFKSNYRLLLLRGFFGGVTMILLFYAYTLIPLSQAMAISFSTPLFIYFGSIFFLKENTDKQKTFYMLLGFFLSSPGSIDNRVGS